MPELPEVETIRRGLAKFIMKKSLASTDILCEKSFQGTPATGTVVGLRRYGKALVIDLDRGHSLMIHLRMTGQLIYDSESAERFAAGHPSESFVDSLPNRQTRVILHFDTGTLYFNDQRKFGFIKVLPTNEVERDPFISKLAPEPWQMPPADFHARLLRHPNSCIKATILDQTVICGLGNIYADEALFASCIHPERRSGSLTEAESRSLLASACAVMDRSIASGGSTMATYVKADGTRGDYLEKFAQVFRREGQPCHRCGTTIVKIRVAGRGAHICLHCQCLAPVNSEIGASEIAERPTATTEISTPEIAEKQSNPRVKHYD